MMAERIRVKCPECGNMVTARKAATRWHPEYTHRMLTTHLNGVSRRCRASGWQVDLEMVSEPRIVGVAMRPAIMVSRPPTFEITRIGGAPMDDRCEFREVGGLRCTGVAGHGDTGREPHTFDHRSRARARDRVIEAARMASRSIPSRYPEIVALHDALVALDAVEGRT